jgi:hypothetical protein
MNDRPRSERRRLARTGTPAPTDTPLLRRRDLILVAAIAVGLVGSVAAIALLSGGGDSEDAGTSATVLGSPTQASAFVPSSPDEAAIESLARRSIEVLPAGQWPSLYDDFTPEFQERCPRQEFVDGGAQNATELGANLPLLAYKRLQQVNIANETATAVVVGEIRGQTEYSVEAAFQQVDGVWKLAPATSTTGCAAFNRLTD